MTKEERRQMRRSQVDAYLASGQTNIKKWCALNGVCDSTLRYWIKILEKEYIEQQLTVDAPGWIEVQASEMEPPMQARACMDGGSCIIAHVDGIVIEIKQGADEQTIGRVLRAARGI